MASPDRESQDESVRQGRLSHWLLGAERYTLYALPLATAVVVAFAVFIAGQPASYRAARVWGGPTDAQRFSGRIMLVERYYEIETALARVPVLVELGVGGDVKTLRASSDASGFLDFGFELPAAHPPGLRLRVLAGERVLASGRLDLSGERWRSQARRRGGWLKANAPGELTVRVRGARGVFAVPFGDRVLVEVGDERGPVEGARVTFRFEGVIEPTHEITLSTDASGQVSQLLVPAEHVVTLGLDVRHENRTQKWYSTLPIVPGALHASLEKGRLTIHSATAREAAFFALVTENTRLSGGHVQLTPDGRGRSSASLLLSDLPRAPLWCVVSSEPDLTVQAAVGWPLSDTSHQTFDVPEALLLDGLPAAHAESLVRPRRVRWLAFAFGIVALGLATVLLARRVLAADARLEAHLLRAGTPKKQLRLLTTSMLGLATAIMCVALGFIVIALISLARIE